MKKSAAGAMQLCRAAALRLLFAGAAALLSLPVLAAGATATAAGKTPVIATSPLRMVWGLLFLAAFVLGGWWLVRRAGGLPVNQGGGLKVVAAVSVGPRERVVLVELSGEQWLLGVAPGCVNLLHRFEQPVVAANNSSDFADKIRLLMQQGWGGK